MFKWLHRNLVFTTQMLSGLRVGKLGQVEWYVEQSCARAFIGP